MALFDWRLHPVDPSGNLGIRSRHVWDFRYAVYYRIHGLYVITRNDCDDIGTAKQRVSVKDAGYPPNGAKHLLRLAR